jgi:D-glycero-alpha-D-manno-heptose-7-phosphate kinase
MSDIPAGTGLGSSGSFTTALLHALHTQQKRFATKEDLAEEACQIEIDILGEPIGKQDQYIAAFGGVTCFTFHPGGKVDVRPIAATEETLVNLEDNLLLFFTGYTRSASSILKDQNDRTRSSDRAMVENLHRVKELGVASCGALESGDLRGFAALMHEHWEIKRKRSGGMSNSHIDDCYDLARKHGALGGKVIGAGGGGFLMFYAEDKGRLRHAMREAGMAEVRLRFDFNGTQVVTQS